jgi:prephenate dehydratase
MIVVGMQVRRLAFDRMPTIAFLGPRGTFTEQAARVFDDDADLIPLPSIPAVVESVRTGTTDFACVPVENSIEGSVAATLDSLADGPPVIALREVVLPIAFTLLARPGTPLGDLRTVASHPHALAQVRNWLRQHLPSAEHVQVGSTAAAAVGVVNEEFDAAITAPVAAECYPLQILARGVADRQDATTRFLLLSKSDTPAHSTGKDRTSVVLVAAHRRGELAAILTELADRELNLTRVESRPLPGRSGEYRFFLDFEGHLEEKHVCEALAAIRNRVRELRFLGSFTRAEGAHARAADSPGLAPTGEARILRGA